MSASSANDRRPGPPVSWKALMSASLSSLTPSLSASIRSVSTVITLMGFLPMLAISSTLLPSWNASTFLSCAGVRCLSMGLSSGLRPLAAAASSTASLLLFLGAATAFLGLPFFPDVLELLLASPSPCSAPSSGADAADAAAGAAGAAALLSVFSTASTTTTCISVSPGRWCSCRAYCEAKEVLMASMAAAWRAAALRPLADVSAPFTSSTRRAVDGVDGELASLKP
mmetsp:Transcript_32045/g.81444  ORF Transcript_32045/g.81444 Transcript_32045/m.81444 type:complete len:227 (-) Transcript_32045:407-1087(-)